jgi:hypothetical protein
MFDNLKMAANQLMTKFLDANEFEEVSPKDLGLDDRSCYRLWKGHDCVVVKKDDLGRFNYYGGGEYVDKDCVMQLGDYVVYSAEDSRVAGWLGQEEEVDPMDDFNYVGSRHHY